MPPAAALEQWFRCFTILSIVHKNRMFAISSRRSYWTWFHVCCCVDIITFGVAMKHYRRPRLVSRVEGNVLALDAQSASSWLEFGVVLTHYIKDCVDELYKTRCVHELFQKTGDRAFLVRASTATSPCSTRRALSCFIEDGIVQRFIQCR